VTNSPDLLIKCHLYHDNYGSDHRGTYSEWYLQAQRNLTAKPRKAYDRADWEKIGKDIHGLFERPGELDSPEALDTVVGRLTRTTANAVDKHIPDLKPSPYSKRWFTVDLKAQQKYVNRLRYLLYRSLAAFRATVSFITLRWVTYCTWFCQVEDPGNKTLAQQYMRMRPRPLPHFVSLARVSFALHLD
jgi:hypothetical protein